MLYSNTILFKNQDEEIDLYVHQISDSRRLNFAITAQNAEIMRYTKKVITARLFPTKILPKIRTVIQSITTSEPIF